jgi:hypothetical protein
MDIMIDIDDVLFPWADGIHERARDAGLHDLPTYTRWAMWEDYDCPEEVWLDVVANAALDGFYVDTPPVPGSVEALRRLHWAGHAIHLVTARGFPWKNAKDDHSEQIREWTDTWVHEHAVPYTTLSYAKDKVAIQEDLGVGFDYALDDGPHNYTALLDAGVNVYLLDRPHNTELVCSAADWGRRVYTVEEFVDKVLAEVRETEIEEYAARVW